MTTSVAPGRLALLMQDLFTVVARLRSDRAPVPDANAFRTTARTLVTTAQQNATQAGYPAADIQAALFAAVALFDESVLNSSQPTLSEWSRHPLQAELFGGHMGGELFYQYLEQQLARPDEPVLGDVLEVFHQALLLGFRGRYGSDAGALAVIAQRVGDRVARIRGPGGDLAPAWKPVDDAVASVDPWVKRLAIGAVVITACAVALWGAGRLSLSRDNDALRALSGPT